MAEGKKSSRPIFVILLGVVVVTCFVFSKFYAFPGFKYSPQTFGRAAPGNCDHDAPCGRLFSNGTNENSTVAYRSEQNDPTWTNCMVRAMDNITAKLLKAKKVTPLTMFTDRSRNLTIYGRIQGGHGYGVFGSTLSNQVALKYLFVLPLSVLAWKRIGFGSVVILVGDDQSCERQGLISYMISKLLAQNATVIVLDADRKNTVMVSQTSRMFAASLLNEKVVDNHERWNETYFMTSDSDIWPLVESSYRLTPGKAILALHGTCCGHFRHKGKRYRMFPMANLGMNQSTWMSVLNRYNDSAPTSSREILNYFVREFGDIARESVVKGSNFGWFMDQKMLSVVVWDWVNKNNTARLDVGIGKSHGRIGVAHWNTTSLGNKTDVHLLSWAYLPKVWNRILPMLQLMHEERIVKWCYDYLVYFRINFTDKKTYKMPTNRVR